MMRTLLLSTLFLAGCATMPPPPAVQSPQGEWVITSIGGQAAEGEGKVNFEAPGGTFNGQAPCNTFGGAHYSLAGDRIMVEGNAAMTLMACIDEARAERERIFSDVLFQSPHFRIDGNRMLLTGPSGAVVELRRAD